MNAASDPTMPDPAVPAWSALPFGSAPGDLDIDLAGGDRTGTVTMLLASRLRGDDGASVAADAIRDWTLDQRLRALIALQLASGDSAIGVHAACAACAEAMELRLDLHALAAAPVVPQFRWQAADGPVLALRLPRGRDLQAWSNAGAAAPAALARALVDTVDGAPVDDGFTVPPGWLPALDDAFEAHDPLTGLQLQTTCPACAHPNRVACDLEGLLLAGLVRMQAGLLDDVLRLAVALHWSEAEILALPRWRRAHYLRRLDPGAWA